MKLPVQLALVRMAPSSRRISTQPFPGIIRAVIIITVITTYPLLSAMQRSVGVLGTDLLAFCFERCIGQVLARVHSS